MRENSKSFYMNFLMICALVAVSISPACKFRSGESSFLEICTALGIKTIEVRFDDSEPVPAQNNNHVKTPCMFCVAGQIHQAVLSDVVLVSSGAGASYYALWQENSIFQSYKTHDYDSTGPPVTS